MIVYQSTKTQFLDDSDNRKIEDVISSAYVQKTGRYASEAEFRSWRGSLQQMARVLRDRGISDDMSPSGRRFAARLNSSIRRHRGNQ